MFKENKNYVSLFMWVITILLIGIGIGTLTKSEIVTWYNTLNRSTLTPPNYVFPIAWTILYILIGISGWMIWQAIPYRKLQYIKIFYIFQLLLNWSWTPLFFYLHFTGYALSIIILMDVTVSILAYITYPKFKGVTLIMMPYLIWIFFATYLNLYIWQHN